MPHKKLKSLTNFCLKMMTKYHTHVKLENFEVLNAGYHCQKFKSKISESLSLIKNKSSLNKQQTSIPLKSLTNFALHHYNSVLSRFISLPFWYGIAVTELISQMLLLIFVFLIFC